MRGDLDDPASLEQACLGHSAVFSIQVPARRHDPDSERRHAANLAAAAVGADVRHLVHTSVSGTGWRSRHPDNEHSVLAAYWDAKEAAEACVRRAGPAYTIVEPAFFYENFLNPKAASMFPLLAAGEILVATAPETRIAMLGAAEFGAAVTAVLADAERFAGSEIELSSDAPTFPQVADAISAVTGRRIVASTGSPAEVTQRGGNVGWTATQVWLDAVGYPARPADAAEKGLSMATTFRPWAEHNAEGLRAVTAPAD